MKPIGEPARSDQLSNMRTDTPVMEHVLAHILAEDGVLDVRPGLSTLGHPQAQESNPGWAASHERATIEYVLRAVLDHMPPNPDLPEYILDRRTAHRWLGSDEQEEWVGRRILEVATYLPDRRAEAIRRWTLNAFHNPAPTG